jgi:hypothetical protein
MIRLLRVIATTLPFLFVPRADLMLELLALRQQLAAVGPRGRPAIGVADRLFWVLSLAKTGSRRRETPRFQARGVPLRRHLAELRGLLRDAVRAGDAP